MATTDPTMQRQHATEDDLEQLRDHILDAPRLQANVAMIVRRPRERQREVLEVGQLDTTVGLVGDSWSLRTSRRTADGSPHPGMQVTLMGTRVIDAITLGDRSRWPLAGDQLFVDMDLSEVNLPPGTRLRVGDAVVEVSEQPHTGCAKFQDRFGPAALRFISTPAARAARLRGVNVAVIASGRVGLGDPVRR